MERTWISTFSAERGPRAHPGAGRRGRHQPSRVVALVPSTGPVSRLARVSGDWTSQERFFDRTWPMRAAP